MSELNNQSEAGYSNKRWFVWGISAVLGLLIVGLLTLLSPKPEPKSAVTPNLSPSLMLQESNGQTSLSGVLPLHDSSQKFLTNIKQIFGDKMNTDKLIITPQAKPAKWLTSASHFITVLPGTEALNFKIDDNQVSLSGTVANQEARQSLLDLATVRFGDKLSASLEVIPMPPNLAELAATRATWHARLSEQIRFAKEAEARAKAEFIAAEQDQRISTQQAQIAALEAKLANQIAALEAQLDNEQRAHLDKQAILEAQLEASLDTQAQQLAVLKQTEADYNAEVEHALELSALIDQYQAIEIARIDAQKRLELAAQQAEQARLAAIEKARHEAELAEIARQEKARQQAEAKAKAQREAELAEIRQRAMQAEQARLARQQAAIQSRMLTVNCEQLLNQLGSQIPSLFVANSATIDGASYGALGLLAQQIRLCESVLQANALIIGVSVAGNHQQTQSLIDYLEHFHGVYPGLLQAINHPVTQSGNNSPLYFTIGTLQSS